MEPFKTKKVHVSELTQGDTLLVNSILLTVSSRKLKNDNFLGYSYDGNYFRETSGMVEIALFPKFYKGEFIGYF
jgi:hypothetical protein